jgi:xanthine dehydrogenase small subunit
VLDHPDALLLAGGTDIGLWVTKQNRLLGPIIQLGGVAELRRITVADGMIEIGAAVSYGDALDRLGAYYPDLGELFRRLGSVQIRNAGTIGGNIGNASPIGDSMPALIALGATLRLRRGATVRDLPLDQFFPGYRQTALAPGEFIQSISLAVPPPDLVFRAYKISKRFDQDISAVCGAFALRLEGDIVAEIRLGFGGMAATPARARRCEARLLGRRWTEAAVAQALPALDEDFVPISDMRASAAYRRLVAGNLLRKFQLESAAGIRLDVLALAAS